MLTLVFEDIEDMKDYPDFDSYARENLDDFHLPTNLRFGIETIDGQKTVIGRDKLEKRAIEWDQEATVEWRERLGL